jgi:undecaprenyl diphosphate synthase
MVNIADIDVSRLPRHIAIIMDGNGRWAEKRHQPRLFGHKAGAESVRDIVETSREIGIRVLTLYAFSSENWKRPEQEVSGLMSILKSYLNNELAQMQKNGIQLRCLGDTDRLPGSVRKAMVKTIKDTAHNTDFILNLALSYGSRDELTRAARLLAADCVAGKIAVDEISADHLTERLYTAGLVDPDLLIRTGGEARLSNFLLWQISYAEIYFTDVMWPDFRRPVYLQAILDYQRRERRFGRTGAQLHAL